MSKVHADFLASNRPDLKYCVLGEPIFFTTADIKSTLKALATMETNSEAVFTMLVVPGLVWPILVGENHLHAAKALVSDHYFPAVTFLHPSIHFCVH